MLQAGGELDLPPKTLTAERHPDLGAQRLEGHEPLVAHVAREIDARPRALPQWDRGVRRSREWRWWVAPDRARRFRAAPDQGGATVPARRPATRRRAAR